VDGNLFIVQNLGRAWWESEEGMRKIAFECGGGSDKMRGFFPFGELSVRMTGLYF
jgi:hypothetical protein